MKTVRPWLVIFISVLVGAAAVYFAAVWVGHQAAIATQKVVVAARDLEVGTRLQPEMLQVIDWPSGAPLKEPFDATDKVRDRVINQQVLRGEPILAAKLAQPGEKGGLSAVLETGKRAITVKVNEIVGVAGFALPGNYVDVMVNTPDEANKSISKIVLERIKVLAVAQDVSTSETKARVVNAVTLEVTPQQAEQIDLARSVGSLSLVLRSQADSIASATSGARKTDLLKPQPLPAPAPAAAVVQASEATKVAGAGPKPVVRRAAAPVAKREPSAAPKAIEVIRGLKRTDEVPPEVETERTP
jgi:pilus assembly protein CpaB